MINQVSQAENNHLCQWMDIPLCCILLLEAENSKAGIIVFVLVHATKVQGRFRDYDFRSDSDSESNPPPLILICVEERTGLGTLTAPLSFFPCASKRSNATRWCSTSKRAPKPAISPSSWALTSTRTRNSSNTVFPKTSGNPNFPISNFIFLLRFRKLSAPDTDYSHDLCLELDLIYQLFVQRRFLCCFASMFCITQKVEGEHLLIW